MSAHDYDYSTQHKVNYTNLLPGLYVSRLDHYGPIMFTTLDLRFCPPNSALEPPLPIAALHTIEHLGNIYLREHSPERNNIVYFGPTGCRTGCRAVICGSYHAEHYKDLFVAMADFIINWHGNIPDATPESCGNYRDHNLQAAKAAMTRWRHVLTSREIGYNQFTYPTT